MGASNGAEMSTPCHTPSDSREESGKHMRACSTTLHYAPLHVIMLQDLTGLCWCSEVLTAVVVTKAST